MILYKYRSFDPGEIWRRLVGAGDFWFSLPAYLDDDEEVSVTWNPPHIEDEGFETEIRTRITLLSLGSSPCNDDLWKRYADDGAGFCVAADFSELTHDQDYYHDKVDYIDGSAIVDMTYAFVPEYRQSPESTIDAIWKKLFFTKNEVLWARQNEQRFLHYSRHEVTGKGFEKNLGASCIKSVSFYPQKISSENLNNLKSVVQTVEDNLGHKIDLISLV